MATHSVPKQWKAGQTNNHVAYKNVCSALKMLEMLDHGNPLIIINMFRVSPQEMHVQRFQ